MEIKSETPQKNFAFMIKATDVPRNFFENRDEAKRYFRRFGKVKLVMFKPKRKTIFVEYANEESMLNALEIAGEYNGHLFNVTRDTSTVVRKKKKKEQDPDWTTDPEVKAELEAMGAFGAPKSYDLRSTDVGLDKIKVKRAPQKKKIKEVKEKFTSEHSELTQIIRQQAFSAEDKFKVLDARDKLIRIKMKKNVALEKVKATIGTCPDMCPEKERLMREAQHQVALYEQGETGKEMNPKLAVKQYSRSSADQEVPLPSELRPVEVLQMTMGYLMHRIMGLCDSPDVNIGEWFHFLWDRTRGIRKDITQQELCCQGSVELVEQCARFHIFCSARLVAEDPSVFDQKINTENLTKCLQTLKYMYHDLQLKGEFCKNEPEFRAYIILLNLNDGNFMWEVQHLEKSIQQSPEVKFALEVYSSLDKRNYVKFFKLVNSTTFLNACILMRYFIQVRLTAVKTFLKSYSSGKYQPTFPVCHLSKILAFENTESAIEFFEAYGLFTNVEKTKIIFHKGSFSQPEYPYILERAVNLVESKRTQPIGEIVCGRQLPPKIYETHVPQNSFDSNGFLKMTPEFEESEKKEPIIVEKSEEAPHPQQSTPIVFPHINPYFFNQSQSSLFTRVETTPTFTTNWETPKPAEFLQEKKNELLELQKIEREKEERRVNEERKFQEEKRRQKEEEMRKEEEERKALMRKMEERRREEMRKAQIQKMLQEQKQREEKQKLDEENRKNAEIKFEVGSVLNQLLNIVEEKVKMEKLQQIKKRIFERKMRKVIKKWRENSRRKRKRKALDFNPLWFGPRSVKEEAEELKMKSQDLALESMKRYKRGKPFEIHIKEEEISKIDLTELTYKILRRKFAQVDSKLQSELFWKITISLPNEIEFAGLNHIEDILDSYVKWQKRGIRTVTIEQSKFIPTITYCLEKQKGFIVPQRNEANGFIFIANDMNENLCQRIGENLKNFGKLSKTPIVLVLQKYTEQKSKLKNLIQRNNISDYLILVDQFSSKNLINLIEEALIFLATRVEKSPPLHLDTLKSFLLKNLQIFWKRANSFAKWNSNYKECLKSPTTAIFLYNEALKKLKAILMDETSFEYAKFPEIFKDFLRSQIPESLPCDYKFFPNFCYHASYIRHVDETVKSLFLPNFLHNWPPKNPSDLESSISQYCAGILKQPEVCFYKVMSIFLKNVDPEFNFQDVKNVVWSDVIDLLILEKFNQTDFSLYGTGFVNKSVFNQLIVIYDVTKLDSFLKTDWFYINNPVIKQKILQLLEEEKKKVVVCEKEEEIVDLDEILAKIESPKIDAKKIKSEVTTCKKLLSDLEESILINKRILETSAHLLKNAIED